MASVWRHPKSQYWTACFRDAQGRQRRASTKETDRKKALRIAGDYEKALRTKRTLRQTMNVLARLHEEVSGEAISQKSLRAYASEWLASKVPETAPRTHSSYQGALAQLFTYLGSRADTPLSELTRAHFV